MTEALIVFFDLIGTIAFAISGALIGISKKMDLFGTLVLAITTACGGGCLRDIMVGSVPPAMCRNPVYVVIAAVVAMMSESGSGLKIRSIRRVGKNNTGWNESGRQEYLGTRY